MSNVNLTIIIVLGTISTVIWHYFDFRGGKNVGFRKLNGKKDWMAFIFCVFVFLYAIVSFLISADYSR
jgi:hypothetical protein